MKNTTKLFVVIAFVAVIGFSMTACKDDEDKGPTYQGNTLNGGAPSSATLAKYGVTNVNGLFNAARAVGDDADYKGYYEDIINQSGVSYSILGLVWYNKTEAKYEAVCDELESEGYSLWRGFDLGSMAPGVDTGIPEGTIIGSAGLYSGYSSNDDDMKYGGVNYYLKDFDDVPKGTLAVVFISISYNMSGGYPPYY